MTALIEASNLVRILPETIPVTLVDGVSLTVQEKEFVAITGPSGSGKSSLLYLLGLLDRPTSGTLLIGGKDTAPMTETERAQTRLAMLGFVFQFHFLLPEFTVRENVEIPMRKLGCLSREAMHERAGELLVALGLEGHTDKLPDQLVQLGRAGDRFPPLFSLQQLDRTTFARRSVPSIALSRSPSEPCKASRRCSSSAAFRTPAR